jgi:hypothetical protein
LLHLLQGRVENDFAWLKFGTESTLEGHVNRFILRLSHPEQEPTFTITVIVTIAPGIGANTAIFSITNAVLLRKLP